MSTSHLLRAWLAIGCYVALMTTPLRSQEPVVSFFDQEISRLTALAESGVVELQIEAAQGFYYLQHHRGEEILLPLVESDSPEVRLHTIKALGECGGRASIKSLIDALRDRDWEVRTQAADALERMTAAGPFNDRREWSTWFKATDWQ